MEESRKQFTFYESFFKAISRIKKAADRAAAYDSICEYALYGTIPDIDKMSDAAAIAFELSKPNLDSSRRKSKSGRKGGANQKQSESKPQANDKQNESKPEANGKQEQTASEKEKENKKEIEIENECLKENRRKEKSDKPTSRTRFVPPTLEEIKAYCQERGNGVDAARFYDYFSVSKWVDSEGKPVKNWKQKIITWERNGNGKQHGTTGRNTETVEYGTVL